MRKIRWGVLGTAHIAEGQTIPGMQNTKNCELYAIAGRSLEKAKEFQNRFHFKKAYGKMCIRDRLSSTSSNSSSRYAGEKI